MKYILAIFLFSCALSANSQNLITYSDTVNHFSISVPSDWKYGPMQSSTTKFQAACCWSDSSGNTLHGAYYKVDISYEPGTDLERSYGRFKKLVAIHSNGIQDEGYITINGNNFRWLYAIYKEDVSALIFSTYKNNKSYLVIMGTVSRVFDRYKPLFFKIASTFTL